MIEITKIPDGHLPQKVGEISFNRETLRPERHFNRRPEWHVKLPCGHTIALTEPTHQVFETADGITVNPSIVCPNWDWHEFIVYNQMG